MARPSSRRVRILEEIRAIPEGFVGTYGDIDPAAVSQARRRAADASAPAPSPISAAR